MIRVSNQGEAFISYRRNGSEALAAMLKYRLNQVLPKWEVFHDHGSIPPGTDFKEVVRDAISRSDLLIVLIDENWVGSRPQQPSRIMDDNDFSRFEVGEALRLDKRILPVLVNNAKMPDPSALPSDIAAMTTKNALELRISRFESDFPHLVKAISGKELPRRPRGGLRLLLASIAYAIVGIIVVVAALIAQNKISGEPLSYWVGETEATFLSIVVGLLAALTARALHQRL
jgi:hypothetical protein